MALLDNCREEIVEFNGLNLLADYLNENPQAYSNEIKKISSENQKNNGEESKESEITACERVQQKAAIAIHRFAKDHQYASLIIELDGIIKKFCNIIKLMFSFVLLFQVIPRLVTLCRNPAERNDSDAVLVACLVFIYILVKLS